MKKEQKAIDVATRKYDRSKARMLKDAPNQAIYQPLSVLEAFNINQAKLIGRCYDMVWIQLQSKMSDIAIEQKSLMWHCMIAEEFMKTEGLLFLELIVQM